MGAKTWTFEIPPASGKFMGKCLRADIDFGAGATEPSDQAKALLDEILAHLPLILSKAEAALAEREKSGGQDYASHVSNPQIWIPEERKSAKAWTLVVERDDWPDFGWHLEFRGSDLVDIWAAD